MNIDANELEHISNMLTNAHLLPLQKEIANLEGNIEQLKEVLTEREKTLAMMRLAMAAKDHIVEKIGETVANNVCKTIYRKTDSIML